MTMFLTAEELRRTGEEKVSKTDAVVKSEMCPTFDESMHPIACPFQTSNGVWRKLESTKEDRGLSCRLSLLRKLFSVKLEDFKDMERYVNEIMSLSQKLVAIGAPLEDEFVGVLLLNGLTEEFQPLIVKMDNGNIKISSEFVLSTLLMQNYGVNKSADDSNDAFYDSLSKKKFKRYECQKIGLEAFEFQNSEKMCSKTLQNRQIRVKKNYELPTTLLTTSACVCVSENDWVIDSGASAHMTMKTDWLQNAELGIQCFKVANDSSVSSQALGNIELIGTHRALMINNVLYVPDLSTNLLSVSQMTDNGFSVLFDEEGCTILDREGNEVANGSRVNGIYKLNYEAYCPSLDSATEEIWHRRLGHPCRRSMKLLTNGLVDGIQLVGKPFREQCISCVNRKQSRTPLPRALGTRATDKLEIVHADLCGPMSELSWGGSMYALTFTDDFSRKSFIYFVKNKFEVLDKFKIFQNFVESQSGESIRIFCSDNSKEYVNRKFQNFLRQQGIIHQIQQNGVSYRLNKILIEKGRCLLEEANLGTKYWAEALNTTNYLMNRTPTQAVQGMTPEEAWTGIKANVSHTRIFGSRVLVTKHNKERYNRGTICEEMLFIGYEEDSTDYRLQHLDNPSQVHISSDVIFFEGSNSSSEMNNNSEENLSLIPAFSEYDELAGDYILSESSSESNFDYNCSEDEDDHDALFWRPHREESPDVKVFIFL